MDQSILFHYIWSNQSLDYFPLSFLRVTGATTKFIIEKHWIFYSLIVMLMVSIVPSFNSSSFSIVFPSPPCRWFIAMAFISLKCHWTSWMLMDVLDAMYWSARAQDKIGLLDVLQRLKKKKKNATNLLICCSYLITLKMTGDGDVFFSVNTSQ